MRGGVFHGWKHRKRKHAAAAAATKSLQSCPTLCDPIDGSPPGPTVPGILQTRTLEWVAISSSNALKWKVKVKSLSRVRLLATPWTAAYQAPPSMGFSRQEYWSGVPLHWKPKNILLEHWVAETERKWKRHAVIESNMKGLGNYVKALELSEEQEEAMISFVF